MRSLTSVPLALPFPISVAVTGSVATSLALLFLFGLILFLSQATHVLVECPATGFLGEHCLEFGAFLEAGFDLVIAVVQSDGGVQTFHMRSQIIDGPALLSLQMSIVFRSCLPLLELHKSVSDLEEPRSMNVYLPAQT